MGTDILTDVRFLRLDKADRWRYTEMIALAKRSVNHTISNDEIGDLLAGFGEPMLLEDIAREIRESPSRVLSFLDRLEQHMPGAIIMREGRYHLTKFAKRQYDYTSDLPHSGPTKAPLHAGPEMQNGPGLDGDGDGDGDGGKEGAAAGCPFCRRPTKGPLQWYHDEAKRVLGRCLTIPPQKAGPAIARVEAQVGQERAHTLFTVYLASEDSFVLKQGYSLLTFTSESIQNGLAAALDGGFIHGSRNRKKRHNTASSW